VVLPGRFHREALPSNARWRRRSWLLVQGPGGSAMATASQRMRLRPASRASRLPGPSWDAAHQDDVVAALDERFSRSAAVIAVADHRELSAHGWRSVQQAAAIDAGPVDAGKRQGCDTPPVARVTRPATIARMRSPWRTPGAHWPGTVVSFA